MKYLIVFALLVSMPACSSKKLTTDGLKSQLEQKTGVTFKYGPKADSTDLLYYVIQDRDLAMGFGRFDSAKSACMSYFNNKGTQQVIMDKAFFKWEKDGFYAVLVSEMDKDSSIVFNVFTSHRPILENDIHQ